MTKFEDYKKHAEDCRAMARITRNEEQRQGLIKMVETWESLAADRIKQMARQKWIGSADGS
jgi:hypothetical protein